MYDEEALVLLVYYQDSLEGFDLIINITEKMLGIKS